MKVSFILIFTCVAAVPPRNSIENEIVGEPTVSHLLFIHPLDCSIPAAKCAGGHILGLGQHHIKEGVLHFLPSPGETFLKFIIFERHATFSEIG